MQRPSSAHLLAAEGAVPAVLDRVVGAAGQELCDLGPSGAEGGLCNGHVEWSCVTVMCNGPSGAEGGLAAQNHRVLHLGSGS